jgi:hypothetical protein
LVRVRSGEAGEGQERARGGRPHPTPALTLTHKIDDPRVSALVQATRNALPRLEGDWGEIVRL